MPPGASVKLDVLHKGDSKVINLTLGQLPNNIEAKADTDNDKLSRHRCRKVGSDGCACQQCRRRRQGWRRRHPGRSEECGRRSRLQEGDVILEVAGKTVSNAGDVRDAINSARDDKKNSVLMRVKTGGMSRFVAIPIAKG